MQCNLSDIISDIITFSLYLYIFIFFLTLLLISEKGWAPPPLPPISFPLMTEKE